MVFDEEGSGNEFTPLVSARASQPHQRRSTPRSQTTARKSHVRYGSSARRMSRSIPLARANTSMRAAVTNNNNTNPARDMAGPCSHGLFCLQCIRTGEVGILETFGEFQELVSPGFVCLPWPCSRVGRLSLRVQQLDVICETKTKDNVFLQIKVAIQFRIIPEQTYQAFYRLTSPRTQIMTYTYDVIRSTIPNLDLEDVFSTSKSSTETNGDIATDVLRRLQVVMSKYGYEILEVLVMDLIPDAKVKDSMNEMNASKRIKESMSHKGEAEKIQTIKDAEAHSETLYLSGVGTSRQRRAIADGMKGSVSGMSSASLSPKDVMDVLILTQYMDTCHAVREGGGSSWIGHYSPQEVLDLQSQLQCMFLGEKQMGDDSDGGEDSNDENGESTEGSLEDFVVGERGGGDVEEKEDAGGKSMVGGIIDLLW